MQDAADYECAQDPSRREHSVAAAVKCDGGIRRQNATRSVNATVAHELAAVNESKERRRTIASIPGHEMAQQSGAWSAAMEWRGDKCKLCIVCWLSLSRPRKRDHSGCPRGSFSELNRRQRVATLCTPRGVGADVNEGSGSAANRIAVEQKPIQKTKNEMFKARALAKGILTHLLCNCTYAGGPRVATTVGDDIAVWRLQQIWSAT